MARLARPATPGLPGRAVPDADADQGADDRVDRAVCYVHVPEWNTDADRSTVTYTNACRVTYVAATFTPADPSSHVVAPLRQPDAAPAPHAAPAGRDGSAASCAARVHPAAGARTDASADGAADARTLLPRGPGE